MNSKKYLPPLPGRVDRYNHELEAEDTEGDEEDMLFHSFSSCSPRYSKVYNPSLEPLMHDVSGRDTILASMALLSPHTLAPPSQVREATMVSP